MATSKIRAQSLEMRKVEYATTVPANGTAHTNLQTLINNDLPSGKRFLAIAGFASNSAYVFLSNIYYGGGDYSLEAKNVSTTDRSTNIVVYYLCY